MTNFNDPDWREQLRKDRAHIDTYLNSMKPRPRNLVVESILAVLGWLWDVWRDWWGAILFIVITFLIVYAITKPGWDQVAQGKPFFLSEFESKQIFMTDCLNSELYTREECILLAGKRQDVWR